MENEGSPIDVLPKSQEGIIGWAESIILTTLQTSIGQSVFKLIDSFLWVIEKSAQWSLPAHEITAEENGKVFGRVELVRPLPWVLFLPSLVILRIIRAGLNVGAFILGYPQIQPSGVVKFMQRSRRRLRTVNLKAIKCARRRASNNKDKRLSMIEAKKALIRSIRLTLSALSCLDASKSSPSPPPTKIRISGMDFETAPTPDEKSTTESAGSPVHTEIKRKYSQVSTPDSSDESEEETLQSKIDRLAQGESSDDPDFNPAECSMQSSTSSEDEANMNISLNELKDIKQDALEICRTNKEDLAILPVDQKLSAKEAETTPINLECGDSPESKTRIISRIANEFIDTERNFSAEPSPAVVAPAQEVTNGITEKPKTHTSGSPPRSRASFSKGSAPMQDKKHSPRKKSGRNSK